MIHLILGGARSGKSSYAEQLCFSLQQKCSSAIEDDPIYIATALAFDDEMHTRIEKHQHDRAEDEKSWQLIECPLLLAELLEDEQKSTIYLVDCLTLWLNNIIFNLGEKPAQQKIEAKTNQLIRSIAAFQNTHKRHLVLVANEVGLGIVPLGSVSRLFVDNAGWLNQGIAIIADTVTLITAGIPLTLKGNSND